MHDPLGVHRNNRARALIGTHPNALEVTAQEAHNAERCGACTVEEEALVTHLLAARATPRVDGGDDAGERNGTRSLDVVIE